MIFNTDNYYDGPVAPSPYPVGIEGALMHVYENECNYNALMKAVGISELKYYQETGKNLKLSLRNVLRRLSKSSISLLL